MIKGIHGMFYSSEPEALRAFLRDKLGFPARDLGGGWLLYDFAQADLGVHPTGTHVGAPPSGTHNVSFYCEDVAQTVAELKAKGVEFTDGITDQGYGLVTHFRMPGAIEAQLYQPCY